MNDMFTFMGKRGIGPQFSHISKLIFKGQNKFNKTINLEMIILQKSWRSFYNGAVK